MPTSSSDEQRIRLSREVSTVFFFSIASGLSAPQACGNLLDRLADAAVIAGLAVWALERGKAPVDHVGCGCSHGPVDPVDGVEGPDGGASDPARTGAVDRLPARRSRHAAAARRNRRG